MDHAGKVHLFIADSVRLFIFSPHPTPYNYVAPHACYAASQFDFTRPPPSLRTRGHRFTVTSAVATEDSRYLFTAGKEGSIIKWDLHTGARLATLVKVRPESTRNHNNNNNTKKGKGKGKQRAEYDGGDVKGHTYEVLALAVSGDGRYLASAGKDRRVGVWDVEKAEWVKGFGGHRDAISVRKSLNSYSYPFEPSGVRTHAHVHFISPAIVARVPERDPATIFRVF